MWMRCGRVTRAITGTLATAIAAGVVALVGYQAGTNVSAEALQAAPAGGQAPAQGRGQGRGGGRAGGPQGGAPVPFESRVGYTQIFNGTSLDGWDGDPAFWRVESGTIVGETTADNPIKENSFLIWRGGRTADFDLKLEFRINAGNSGVQYRSRQLVPGGPENVTGRWVLAGYQADIDFANQYTGMLYEERGRAFLAPRGQFNYIGPNQPPSVGRGQPPPEPAPGAPPFGVRGQLGALKASDEIRALIKQNDWNQFQVVARGNVLVHVLNGQVTALFVDDDTVGRSLDGLLGLQIHTGPPMKVEFRNVYIRQF